MLSGGGVIVNGRTFPFSLNSPTSSYSLFDLLEMVREEVSLSTIFQTNPQPPSLPRVGSDDVRVDVMRGAKGRVVFFNNVEKDSTYYKWGDGDYRKLTEPRQQGEIARIRRNLFTTILAFDPTSANGLTMLNTLMIGISQFMLPMRLGFIFHSTDSPEDDRGIAGMSASDFSYLFSALNTISPDAAISFMSNVVDEFVSLRSEDGASSNEAITKTRILSFYADVRNQAEKKGRKARDNFMRDALKFLNSDDKSPELMCKGMKVQICFSMKKKMDEYLDAKGLPMNSLTVNGEVLRIYPPFTPQTLLNSLRNEQKFLTSLYEENILTNDKSVLAALKDTYPVRRKYHPELDSHPMMMTYLSFSPLAPPPPPPTDPIVESKKLEAYHMIMVGDQDGYRHFKDLIGDMDDEFKNEMTLHLLHSTPHPNPSSKNKASKDWDAEAEWVRNILPEDKNAFIVDGRIFGVDPATLTMAELQLLVRMEGVERKGGDSANSFTQVCTSHIFW